MKNLLLFLSVAVNGYFFIFAPKVLRVHTPSDILYVDAKKNQVTFEGNSDTLDFKSFQDMEKYVKDFTLEASAPSGYARDIRWQSMQGYITTEVHPAVTEDGKVISPVGTINLIYSGPNWGHDEMKDTTFVITTFNSVEARKAEYDECLECTYDMYVGYKKD